MTATTLSRRGLKPCIPDPSPGIDCEMPRQVENTFIS